jgi:hypothetical protein
MIRPPSNIQPYTECYSGDEALLQDANLLRVARETGDWSPVIIEGMTPTKFTLRPLQGRLLRKISDLEIGGATKNSVIVRAAVIDVIGLDGFKLKLEPDKEYGLGSIATQEFTDCLDFIDAGIVNELALLIWQRALLRPKS